MKAIMAADPKGGIGYQNRLPWDKLENDLSRFKNLTAGKQVLMGRKTWSSLPVKPLPNRTNIVLASSSHTMPTNIVHLSDVNQIEQLDTTNLWFIGGAYLLSVLWPRINEFHLTRTKQNYTCDTYINLLYLEQEFYQIQKQEYSDNWYEIWQRK